MTEGEDFLQWVSDPARTSDELFTVEMLLERNRGHNWPLSLVETGFEAELERARARKLNPGYRPALHHEELLILAERAATLKHFSGAHNDRPFRNLEALRFFPALENVQVQSSDVKDFRPLASLTKVQSLSIAEYSDLYGCHPTCLAECGEMPVLSRVHLALTHPWPDLRGLSQWRAVSHLSFNGNILALEDVPEFPAARTVRLSNWPGQSVALRSLRRLPLMPKARQVTLATAATLDGVERYPSVLNLDIAGCFSDLTPLSAMDNITALTLRSERFDDLRPLTKMARLREITFSREWPLDLSPLADCPQLRRVVFERCAMMRTEVSALNAGLLPEEMDFKAEQPRPIRPLRCYRLEKEDNAGSEFFTAREQKLMAEREQFYDGDLAMAEAEKRAFTAAMQTGFDALLGRGWGIFQLPYTSIKRYADSVRVMELVELVREYSAQSRFPLYLTLIVAPHADMSDELAEIKKREAETSASDGDYLLPYYEPKRVLDENEEQRRAREDRYRVLQREHLRRLRGDEEGDLPYPPEDEPEEEEEEEPLASIDEEESEGGVAIAPPPPAPPDSESLSDDLMFYLAVYEDCVVVNSQWADRAEYTLGVPFVIWTPEVVAELD